MNIFHLPNVSMLRKDDYFNIYCINNRINIKLCEILNYFKINFPWGNLINRVRFQEKAAVTH